MEEWDAQKMLDKYIHDYMIRKNMHTTAEIFANEANISPEPAAVNPPEGFLTEWWSLFWDVYSAKLPTQPEATKDDSDKNVNPVLQRPEMNCMLPSVCPQLPKPILPDFPPNVYSTMTPRTDMGSMLQSALPTTTSRPELNLNGLGLTPMSDTTIDHGQPLTNWISENMSEQERLMLSARDMNFNARLLNAGQLASLPPFSIDSRYLQQSVQQGPQRSGFTNGRPCTYVGGSSAMKAVPHEALKPKQPKTPDDTVRGKRKAHVSSGGLPSSQGSMSHLVEQSVGKQILTNFGCCALGDDGLNGKDLQSGKTATSEDPLDGYVKSFFLDEEAMNDLSSSFCTSPGSSLSRGGFQPKGK